MSKITLTTVLSFIFNQGILFDDGEQPVQVKSYRDGVDLCQEDNEVYIKYEYLNSLIKEIKGNKERALSFLTNKL